MCVLSSLNKKGRELAKSLFELQIRRCSVYIYIYIRNALILQMTMLVLATFAPASPGKISNAWFPSMAWSSLHDAFFLPLDITSQTQVRACTRYHTFSPHQCIFIHLLLPCTCTLTFSCILTHAFYCSLIAPSLPLLLIICDGECLALIRHESHNVSSSYFFLQTKKKTRR